VALRIIYRRSTCWLHGFSHGQGKQKEATTSSGHKNSFLYHHRRLPAYFRIEPTKILQGREINDIDIAEKRKVALIGIRVRNEMFEKDENPVGSMSYRVSISRWWSI